MKIGRQPVSHRAMKIAISLPPGLFREVERTRKAAGVGRSALVQKALEDFMLRRERAVHLEKYVQSYRQNPEGRAEIESARASAAKLLAGEPWE